MKKYVCKQILICIFVRGMAQLRCQLKDRMYLSICTFCTKEPKSQVKTWKNIYFKISLKKVLAKQVNRIERPK